MVIDFSENNLIKIAALDLFYEKEKDERITKKQAELLVNKWREGIIEKTV